MQMIRCPVPTAETSPDPNPAAPHWCDKACTQRIQPRQLQQHRAQSAASLQEQSWDLHRREGGGSCGTLIPN